MNNINKLPFDLGQEIYSYLKPSDLGKVCAVDKRRNEEVSTAYKKTPSLKDRVVYRDFAFNSKDWEMYCQKGVDVDKEGEMSSFPKNIWQELNKSCEAFPDKRVGQTHVITWMPKSVGGEPLTLNRFGGILKERFPKNDKGYSYIWAPITSELGEIGLAKSYWVLMRSAVIPKSGGKSYATQQRLVAELDEKTPYEVPKTLEAVVCISTKYFKSGERLFSNKPLTYTRCQEQVQGYQIVVGGFSADGLKLRGNNGTSCDDDSIGVGALRSSVLDT